MPAALDINWDAAKLDFIRLRTEGVKYEHCLIELADRYGCKSSTVRYRATKDKWADTLNASKQLVENKLRERLEISAEKIAEEMGAALMEGIQELRAMKATKVQDSYVKAQAAKTYSEVRSRFNPDGQEKSGPNTLVQLNLAPSAPTEQTAQVTDVKTVQS